MAKFRIEEEVVQIIQLPIEGRVKERRVDGDDDLFLVYWTDSEAEGHERWFREDEIKPLSVKE